MVVHPPRVAVRAAPSITAALVRALSVGTEVYGHPQPNGWLRLVAPTDGEGALWMLIDGRPHGLPLLLHRVRCNVCEPLRPLGGRATLELPDMKILVEPSRPTAAFTATKLPNLPLEPPPLFQAPLHDAGFGMGDALDESRASLLLRTLARRGFCLCSTGLSTSLVAAARAELAAINASGAMEAGYIAADVAHALRIRQLEGSPLEELHRAQRQRLRSDHSIFFSGYVHGLKSGETAPMPPKLGAVLDGPEAQYPALARIQSLLVDLGTALGKLLDQAPRDPTQYPMRFASDMAAPPTVRGFSDMQCSCYQDATAQYMAHTDNVRGEGSDGRLLTMVLYLNDEHWGASDGGALRIWVPREVVACEGFQSDACAPYIDACPRGGTLCVFRSDRVLHAVRPPTRQRFAVTVWVLADGF